MPELFHCSDYNLNIPAEKQREFCAVQFRKERVICIDCETGRRSAKEDREMVEFQKTCKKCEKTFTGGRTSRYCSEDCKPKKQTGGGKKSAKKPKAERKSSRADGKMNAPAQNHESVKVLETLVAIGAITSAQVEATRKYVQEMFT